MFSVNCSICMDRLKQEDEVQVTKCGHVFHKGCLDTWRMHSNTCPQCRSASSNEDIFRIYFNMTNSDESHVDVDDLIEQLDSVKLELKLKQIDSNILEEDVKLLMIRLIHLEDHNTALLSNVQSLQSDLEIMKGFSTLLTSTTADAMKIISNEPDHTKLGIWAATLVYKLRKSKQANNMLRTELEQANNTLSAYNSRKAKILTIQRQQILDRRAKKFKSKTNNDIIVADGTTAR